MSKPEIKNIIGGFDLLWKEEKLNILISRLHVHTDGRVTGELLIKSPDGKSLYPQTSFNFTSERTRSALIKTLSEQDSSRPWGDIINQLSLTVVDRARQGEPVQELWTGNDVKRPEYLLEPFIYKGLPNILYGEKGVNKSTLALAFYLCLVLPWKDNPLELTAPSRSIKSLILDWETEGDIVQYYLSRLQLGHGLQPLQLIYRRCSLPLADDLEQIERNISDTGAEVIIIDSLGAAAGGDLNGADIALKFFAALRQLKVTSLIIGQVTKDENTKTKKVFGSHFFTYYSRNIWEISKSEGISDDEYDLALFHRSPNLSAPLKPIGFRFHWNETGLSIERQPVNVAEFMTKVSSQLRILELLRHGPKKPKDIAMEIDTSENTVRVLLSKLKKKGKVLQTENGYGLVTTEELL